MYKYRNPIRNLKEYKSLHPPVYNLSNIKFPCHLFVGEADLLATVAVKFKVLMLGCVRNYEITF